MIDHIGLRTARLEASKQSLGAVVVATAKE